MKKWIAIVFMMLVQSSLVANDEQERMNLYERNLRRLQRENEDDDYYRGYNQRSPQYYGHQDDYYYNNQGRNNNQRHPSDYYQHNRHYNYYDHSGVEEPDLGVPE